MYYITFIQVLPVLSYIIDLYLCMTLYTLNILTLTVYKEMIFFIFKLIRFFVMYDDLPVWIMT